MPPVLAAVAAAASAAVTGASLASIALKVAISVVVSIASQALTPKPKRPSVAATVADVARGRTEMIRQPLVARRVIYGEVMVSGPIVYAQSSGTSNNFLSLVLALAGHECDSFSEYWLDDGAVTIDGDNAVQAARWLDAGTIPRAWLYPHLGDPDQVVDPVLTDESGGKWTNEHRLRGICYMHMRLEYRADVYPDGVPKFRGVVKGKKVYDPRAASTAWSDNPALCLRDYLTSYLGVASSEINDTTVSAAANVCDESVTLASGGSESRYACNGTISLDEEPARVINDLLSAMAGVLTFSSGKYNVYAGAATSSSLTIDESDVIGTLTVQTRVSRSDLFNKIKAQYIDPSRDWQSTTSGAVSNSTYEAEDNGVIEKTLDLPFTTSESMAQRLAKIDLERVRQQIAVQMTVKPAVGWRLQAWDVVAIDNDRMGWSGKLFRVVGWTMNPDWSVGLSLREEAAAMWSWSTEETLVDLAPNTNLPNPFNMPAPGGLAVAEELATTASGTVITQLLIDVTEVERPFVIEYELQWKPAAESAWRSSGRQDSTRFQIVNVTDGVEIDIRARAVNAIGTISAWREVSYTPIGQTAPPEDVANFAANFVDSTAHLSWDPVGDIDLSHYRLRWAPVTTGASWAAAVDLVTKIGRQATSVSVPAQTGSYLIKAVDLKGNESANATVIASTISSVQGLNVVETVTEDSAFAGTHSDTVAVAGQLKLNGADTLADWDRLSDVDVLALGDGAGVETAGTYTFAGSVDLGDVYTSRLTASIKNIGLNYGNLLKYWNTLAGVAQLGGADNALHDARLQVRTTDDDPSGSPTWSDWRDFVVGDYSARAFQFRCLLSSQQSGVTPLITELSVTVDMPDRTIDFADETIPAAGKTFAFSPAFRVTPTVGVTGQDLDSGDYWRITAKSASGATIRFFNAGGTGVEKTADIQVKGYGRAA